MECINGHVNELDGLWSTQMIGGQLRFMFEALTPDELTSVRASLQSVLRQPDATVETVAQSVEPTAPGLAAWIREKSNANQGVIALVGLLLVIIQMVAQGLNASPEINVTINNTINQFDRGEVVEEPPIPRRHPCFCGSGKRFKNCHGREVRAKYRVDRSS